MTMVFLEQFEILIGKFSNFGRKLRTYNLKYTIQKCEEVKYFKVREPFPQQIRPVRCR